MHWPGGRGTTTRLDGRARDLLSPAEGEPVVVDEGSFSADIGPDRTIAEITVEPHRDGAESLVGARSGGGFRAALDESLPGEGQAGTPLYLILDDIAGSSLIAGFAWLRRDRLRGALAVVTDQGAYRSMEGTCAGFRAGSSADDLDVRFRQNVAPTPPLADPSDAWSWHALDLVPPVAMRRSRRIDVWRTKDGFAVDAMFRDSTWEPDGTEVVVHEYRIDAAVDATTGELRSISAEPRVLPYPECPAAAPNVAWLVGEPVRALRSSVLARLRGDDCCTHLNDALRALAEVPVLMGVLDRAMPVSPPG
jgi:hypothetical protein